MPWVLIMSDAPRIDLLVVGAGIVGSALVLRLLQSPAWQNKRIVMLEPNRVAPVVDPAPYGLRVSSLSLASLRFLAQSGVGAAIDALRQGRYEKMVVWDHQGTGRVSFDASSLGLPFLGSLLENDAVQAVLQEALLRHPQVTFCCPDAVQRLDLMLSGWRVTSRAGQQWHAELVVAADGPLSPTRSLMTCPVWQHDYQAQALVSTLRTTLPHQKTAWQVFLPTGPLALLPLPDGHHVSLVWTLPTDQAHAWRAQSTSGFGQEVSRRTEHVLGEVEVVGERVSFPLVARHVARYDLPQAVLLGDAAHSIHPLAGQGVNLGLADAEALAEVLIAQVVRHLPLAAPDALARYSRLRRQHNVIALQAMTGFERLFSRTDWPSVVLRQWGMNQFDRVSLLKKQAMTMAGSF